MLLGKLVENEQPSCCLTNAAVKMETNLLIFLFLCLFVRREKRQKIQDIRKNVKDAIVVSGLRGDLCYPVTVLFCLKL